MDQQVLKMNTSKYIHGGKILLWPIFDKKPMISPLSEFEISVLTWNFTSAQKSQFGHLKYS